MSLLLQRIKGDTPTPTTPAIEPPSEMAVAYTEDVSAPPDPLADLKFRIHERLIRELDPAKLAGKNRHALRTDVEEAARTLLAGEDIPMARQEKVRLITEIADEVLGFGPLEPLLDDPTITEIMVNGPARVYFEREGKLFLSDRVFRDDGHVMRVIEKIVSPLGRRIDDGNPMVDARLPDGSRVNAVIPPLSIDGPVITIRKFARDPLTVDDMISFGTLTPEMVEFLRACVQVRLNILVSGGTGSGKTTLLNVLSSFIPSTERIVTIEDPAELQLQQRHTVRLETRPANVEGRGLIGQRELVRNALRMRPDRIIVGEVRAGEAFDMLQAMNTGHDGSLTTVHANSPRDALARIENMVLMSGLELPVRAIREQVSSALHVILQLARLPDGTRKVIYVTEVAGMEGQTTTLQDIFVFQQMGLDKNGRVIGHMRATGLRPRCYDRLEQAGIILPPSLFVTERV
ncbi:MAG: CpaF family protein [Chloroflexota bacterium]|nr:MAG: CpaF family protein [Chloroflexota bacterium]